MLVDSHCHLHTAELKENVAEYLKGMAANGVTHALVVATNPDNIPEVLNLAAKHANLFAAIGVHPDEKLTDFALNSAYFQQYLQHEKLIAIGETGLDYHWTQPQDAVYQLERFQLHIEVAKTANLPLIV